MLDDTGCLMCCKLDGIGPDSQKHRHRCCLHLVASHDLKHREDVGHRDNPAGSFVKREYNVGGHIKSKRPARPGDFLRTLMQVVAPSASQLIIIVDR